MQSSDSAEERFNRMTLEERTKIQQETLVNVGGYKRQSTYKQKGEFPAFSHQFLHVMSHISGAYWRDIAI